MAADCSRLMNKVTHGLQRGSASDDTVHRPCVKFLAYHIGYHIADLAAHPFGYNLGDVPQKEAKDAKNAEIARLKSALSEKEPTPVRAEAVAAEPVKSVVSDQPQSSNVNNINISLAKDEDKGVAHCCHCMLWLVTVGFWTPCWIGACCDCCCQRPCNAKC